MPWFHATFALLFVGTCVHAADWPQWLGLNRDASSSETVAAWKDAPKIVWRQPVGEGHSSPVVAGGRVFVHAKVKDKDEERLTALDAQNGKPIWHANYARDKFSSIFGNGPRATPAVAGDRVYTLGVTGVLGCFKADSGVNLWQVDTLKKFDAKNLFFGVSCSPLVEGNRVLVNVGAKGASIVAFDKDNGTALWQSMDDPASYSSPIIFGGNDRQVVFLTQQNVVSLNPADGTVFWKYPLVDKLFESSTTPVKAGDLLLASAITYGSVGLHLETKDGKPAMEEAWKNPTLTCYFSTPIAVGKEHVYMVTGSNPLAIKKAAATLRCIETRSGKELWNKPGIGKYHASLLRTADDKLLMLDDSGNLILLDPNPKEYRELARARVCGEAWAHPALANGLLYVRDNEEVICVQLAGTK